MTIQTAACPYCGHETTADIAPPLARSQRRLYDLVVKSGSRGAPYEEVRKLLWGTKQRSDTTVRTRMHRINEQLRRAGTGTAIISRGNSRLFLVRI